MTGDAPPAEAGSSGRMWLQTSLETRLVLACRLGWRREDLRREVEQQHRQLFPDSGAVVCTGVQLWEGEQRYDFPVTATLAELAPELAERQSRVKAWAELTPPSQAEERLPNGAAGPSQHQPQPEASQRQLAGAADAATIRADANGAASRAAEPPSQGLLASAADAAAARVDANGAADGAAEPASPKPKKSKKRRRESQAQQPGPGAPAAAAGEQAEQAQDAAASEQPAPKRRKQRRSDAQPASHAGSPERAAPASPPAATPGGAPLSAGAGAGAGAASGRAPAPQPRRSSAVPASPAPQDWQLPEGGAAFLAGEVPQMNAARQEHKRRLKELLRKMCVQAGVGPIKLYTLPRPCWWPPDLAFTSRAMDRKEGLTAVFESLQQHFGIGQPDISDSDSE